MLHSPFWIFLLVVSFQYLLGTCVAFSIRATTEGTAARLTSPDKSSLPRRRPDKSIIPPSESKYRSYCPACQRPYPQCLCPHLPPQKIQLQTHILVLQHPVEFRRKTISTTPLLSLNLEYVQVLVGREFEGNLKLERALEEAKNNGRMPLLLFPGENAITLEDLDAVKQLQAAAAVQSVDSQDSVATPQQSDNPQKYLLILVDGTWTQAKRMLRNSPSLVSQCQLVQFTSTSDKSIYDSIRKQPDPHCLSTLESCERTLRLIEPHSSTNGDDPRLMESASKYLLGSLKAMILTQMKYEQRYLEKHPASIRNASKLKEKQARQHHILMSQNSHDEYNDENDDDTSNSRRDDKDEACCDEDAMLPEGYTLRPLAEADAKFVDSRWPFRSNKSLVMIEKQILADTINATRYQTNICLGIDFNDGSNTALVACVIRHRNGSIGILHVDPEHRRLGLAEAVLKHATMALIRRQDEAFAYIVDGNTASENLFTKLGWVRANPLEKKGTGKRKAKRLWIHPLEEEEKIKPTE